MKLYTILILVSLSFITSECQNTAHYQAENDVYVSSPMPYIVEGHNPVFVLPKYLSKGRDGNAVLEVFLNTQGILEGFNITFLKLANGNEDSLRHYNYVQYILQKDEYAKEIQDFLPIFDEYISRLRFIRDENIKVDEHNKYLIKIPLHLE